MFAKFVYIEMHQSTLRLTRSIRTNMFFNPIRLLRNHSTPWNIWKIYFIAIFVSLYISLKLSLKGIVSLSENCYLNVKVKLKSLDADCRVDTALAIEDRHFNSALTFEPIISSYRQKITQKTTQLPAVK